MRTPAALQSRTWRFSITFAVLSPCSLCASVGGEYMTQKAKRESDVCKCKWIWGGRAGRRRKSHRRWAISSLSSRVRIAIAWLQPVKATTCCRWGELMVVPIDIPALCCVSSSRSSVEASPGSMPWAMSPLSCFAAVFLNAAVAAVTAASLSSSCWTLCSGCSAGRMTCDRMQPCIDGHWGAWFRLTAWASLCSQVPFKGRRAIFELATCWGDPANDTFFCSSRFLCTHGITEPDALLKGE